MTTIEDTVTDAQAKAILQSLTKLETVPNPSYVFLRYDEIVREYGCEQLVASQYVQHQLTSEKPQGFVPWYVAYTSQQPKINWSDADLEQHRQSRQQ